MPSLPDEELMIIKRILSGREIMESAQLPLVTIGALNYNNERFVIETLESIKDQTFTNIELIIVDDGSTDSSLTLIKDWLLTYPKKCKLIEHSANLGIAAACESIYVAATGKYVSFIATDDVLLPGKTEEQVAILESRSDEYAAVYGDALIINEEGKLLTEKGWKPARWQDKNFVPPSGNIFLEVVNGIYFYLQTGLINLELFRKTGYKFDKNILADDYDMQLVLSRNYKIYGSAKPYIKYRLVQSSFSNTYVKQDRVHKLHRGMFYMFTKYLNHPRNTKEENEAIIGRLRGLLWNLEQTAEFTRRDRIIYIYKILRKTFSISDSYLLLKAIIVYTLRLNRRKPPAQIIKLLSLMLGGGDAFSY